MHRSSRGGHRVGQASGGAQSREHSITRPPSHLLLLLLLLPQPPRTMTGSLWWRSVPGPELKEGELGVARPPLPRKKAATGFGVRRVERECTRGPRTCSSLLPAHTDTLWQVHAPLKQPSRAAAAADHQRCGGVRISAPLAPPIHTHTCPGGHGSHSWSAGSSVARCTRRVARRQQVVAGTSWTTPAPVQRQLAGLRQTFGLNTFRNRVQADGTPTHSMRGRELALSCSAVARLLWGVHEA